MASHVGTLILDAINIAPLVGTLQAGMLEPDENVNTAPLVGGARKDGTLAAEPMRTPPLVTDVHNALVLPVL
jgi:hypothetical protein